MHDNTQLRHDKIWREYEFVCRGHGAYASQIKKATLYEEVALRTDYSYSLVEKVIRDRLKG